VVAQCPHCEADFYKQNVAQHAAKCLANPDTMDLFIAALDSAMGECNGRVTSSLYEQHARRLNAPGYLCIRSQLDTQSWVDVPPAFGLREGAHYGRQRRTGILSELDAFLTYGDMIAAGLDTMAVFDELRADRDALGTGNLEEDNLFMDQRRTQQ